MVKNGMDAASNEGKKKKLEKQLMEKKIANKYKQKFKTKMLEKEKKLEARELMVRQDEQALLNMPPPAPTIVPVPVPTPVMMP